MDAMIDIETAATTPNALILTIAAQSFDPFSTGNYGEGFYVRVDIESQENRDISDSTIDWWTRQSPEVKEEAFSEEGRVSLSDALDGLHKIAWNSNKIWMQGPFFDATILENAYKSLNKPIPWQFWNIRDSRTLTSLVPDLQKPPVSHHALEDCRSQIILVQDALDYLKVRSMK